MNQFQGEANIRLRFTEYIKRFTSLAAYQEYAHTGRTKIGFPPTTFRNGQLGTGTVFVDDAARIREMRSNGHRIDAWRKTDSYKLYVKVSLHSKQERNKKRADGQDWQKEMRRRTTSFDLERQVTRLKKMARLSEDELAAIYAALAMNVREYHQVVEVSPLLASAGGTSE
jgi:hypothetical protein